MPDSLKIIDEFAFGNCSALEEINLPEGLEEICDSAFSDCEGLTSVNLPKGLKKLGAHAFDCCYKLTEVVIPASVEEIGRAPFFLSGNKKLVVYCGAEAKPDGWDKDWDVCDGLIFKKRFNPVWGFKG